MTLSVNKPNIPRNLIATAASWLAAGDSLALLTLVGIEGSAPYPLGSQMLVNQRGQYQGQITGGCAEVAIAEQAANTLTDGENRTQRYGRGSPFFDIQLPCGSGIDIFIDVSTTLKEYQHLQHKLESRVQATQTYDTGVGKFLKIYSPNERLLAFGQGPILSSLCQLALASGFEVVYMIKDGTTNSQDELNDMTLSSFSQVQSEMVEYCDGHTAIVSLFHEHEHEIKLLSQALLTKAFYIGALGSRATQEKRLEQLAQTGLDESQLNRIHGPVGLDIKSETPAQIAISILAQIVQNMPKQSHQGKDYG